MIEIETERLMIKPFSMKYIEDYYQGFTDEVTKYQYPDSFQNIEDATLLVSDFVHEMELGNMLELMIVTKAGEFIGSMEAFDIKGDTPEIGLWLKESSHRKGYGSEALSALLDYLNSFHKYKYYIYEVDVRNKGSICLVEKFRHEKKGVQDVITESGKKLQLQQYFILSEQRI